MWLSTFIYLDSCKCCTEGRSANTRSKSNIHTLAVFTIINIIVKKTCRGRSIFKLSPNTIIVLAWNIWKWWLLFIFFLFFLHLQWLLSSATQQVATPPSQLLPWLQRSDQHIGKGRPSTITLNRGVEALYEMQLHLGLIYWDQSHRRWWSLWEIMSPQTNRDLNQRSPKTPGKAFPHLLIISGWFYAVASLLQQNDFTVIQKYIWTEMNRNFTEVCECFFFFFFM